MVVQKETFTSEYQCLKSNSPLKIRSKLLQLSPILVNNLIKVGGRLRHSNLPQYHKHQAILPANHHVTTLIINYVGAERELRTLLAKLNQNKISSTLINKNIIWKFNPPSSPWMGGSWESIVKITKKCLKFVTKERPVYEDSLVTFLAEVENTLNSRPLTSLSDDSNYLSVLTPNHFLLGRQPLYFSPATIKDEHVNSRTR